MRYSDKTRYRVAIIDGVGSTQLKDDYAKTLKGARKLACKYAKCDNNGQSVNMVGIMDITKNINSPIERVWRYKNYTNYAHQYMDGCYIRTNNRTYRLSSKTGRLLDYNRYWRYV